MDIRDWEEKYYSKQDKKERKDLLDERVSTGEDSQELELIQKLFDIRYKPAKGEPEQIDHMLRAMMELKFLQDGGKGLFSRSPRKHLQSVYQDLGKDTAENYGETGRRIWYRECNHAGKTFLTINLGDRGYTSMFWGLGQLKDPVVKNKLAKDIYVITCKVPEELGITQELEVFSAAVQASYYESFPQDANILREMIQSE